MKEVTNHNLHSADSHGQPLGAICLGCGKRGLLSLKRIGAHSGNMKQLHDLPLKCSRCSSRGVQLFLFFNLTQAEAFGQGKSAAEVHALRHADDSPDDPWVRNQRPTDPPAFKWPPVPYAAKHEIPDLPGTPEAKPRSIYGSAIERLTVGVTFDPPAPGRTSSGNDQPGSAENGNRHN